MFPSTTNNGENSFPPIQPSFYSSRSSFFAGYTDNVHAGFYHHHDQLFHHGSVAPPPSDTVNSWAALSNPMLTNQEMNRLTVDEQCAPPLDNQLHKTPPVKKDRHSKIVTAQGPRDRRVRLSIGIAQQFFGLQDMLGFDKASATLAWLLKKSKASIEELAEQMKNSGNELANVQSSVSECENGDSEAKSLVNLNQPQNSAKESRAKARARARERTRKKMSTMAEKVVLHGTNPYTPNPSLSLTQLGATNMKPDSDMAESIFHHIVQQPLSTKTKMKPSSISGFHDAKSEEICFPYTTKDWDTASSFTGSSMYATSNISSSKVLQIHETPWEV